MVVLGRMDILYQLHCVNQIWMGSDKQNYEILPWSNQAFQRSSVYHKSHCFLRIWLTQLFPIHLEFLGQFNSLSHKKRRINFLFGPGQMYRKHWNQLKLALFTKRLRRPWEGILTAQGVDVKNRLSNVINRLSVTVFGIGKIVWQPNWVYDHLKRKDKKIKTNISIH